MSLVSRQELDNFVKGVIHQAHMRSSFARACSPDCITVPRQPPAQWSLVFPRMMEAFER